MEYDLKVPDAANMPDSANDRTERLLVHAIMLSAGAQDDLSRARASRLEAERVREQAEAESAKAIDEAFSYARTQAQKLMEEASAAKASAEADRLQVQKELEQAAAARIEAEKIRQQLEAEAKERPEQLMQEALRQAEDQVLELKRRAAEEVRKILEDVGALRAAAQEELEAQRLLTAAARVRAEAPRLDTLTTHGPEQPVHSNGNNAIQAPVAEPITSPPTQELEATLAQEPEAATSTYSAPQHEPASGETTSRKPSKRSGAGGSQT